jgi:hypothetical protein
MGWFSKKSEIWKCDSCPWQRPLDAVNVLAEAEEHQATNRGHIIWQKPEEKPQKETPFWWWGWILLVLGGLSRRLSEPYVGAFAVVLISLWLVGIVVHYRRFISSAVVSITGVSGNSRVEVGFRRIVTLISSAVFLAAVSFAAYDGYNALDYQRKTLEYRKNVAAEIEKAKHCADPATSPFARALACLKTEYSQPTPAFKHWTWDPGELLFVGVVGSIVIACVPWVLFYSIRWVIYGFIAH